MLYQLSNIDTFEYKICNLNISSFLAIYLLAYDTVMLDAVCSRGFIEKGWSQKIMYAIVNLPSGNPGSAPDNYTPSKISQNWLHLDFPKYIHDKINLTVH